MFENWATPVVNKKWGVIATVAFWFARLTDFSWLHHFKCIAWQKAVGVPVKEM
jgi:hypothetical protein